MASWRELARWLALAALTGALAGAALGGGCAPSEIAIGPDHPASPRASSGPPPALPPTLRPDFDPERSAGDKPPPYTGEPEPPRHHHHHGHAPAPSAAPDAGTSPQGR